MTTLTPDPPVQQQIPATQPGRLLSAPDPSLGAHVAVHGPMPRLSGAALVHELELAGLTGRGGAGFPAAVKIRAVAQVSSGDAVVVGNAAEGEPASAKDRQLLLSAPHLVLDGLQLAATAVSAERAILYVRPDTIDAVHRALAERSGDPVAVQVVPAASGFVAGQETAVVSRLDGGPARPRFSRIRVTERGVGGHPTLVQNVETLAQLALIARHGGTWFAGTGTFLATLHDPSSWSASGRTPGRSAVWEVPYGTTLAALLSAASTAGPSELQAVLIGGYHGTWLRAGDLLDRPLSPDSLAPLGASLGAGVIMPITHNSCGLDVTAQIVRYLAGESAQQCGPCQFGLPRLSQRMSALASGRGATAADLSELRTAAGLVEGRGACHHPDGTARLVRSALITFDQDVVLHSHGRCLARIGDQRGGLL